ncbi:hypothetical protein KDA_62610 [Dictyobacter alpinus]|uniref:Integral membrane bound transporter domain-containing protein n=2 Tax=Dictyobacter alpinus TaxID=2014873 RepID=A0A402BHP8_9CHLR|nr:hypothetical protein KDA_62610 [Dictyobacter alpinus]
MVFQLDRSQLVITRSIISTFAFVLPLAIGIMTGHIIEGVSIAGGASSLGTVSLTATHSIRLRTMLLAALGVAISACIGALTEPYPWLSILAIGLWSFATGLFIVISLNAMIIGLQSTIAMIILTHFTLSPVQALLQALLMFIGALLQIALSLVPFRQQVGSESSVLTNTYQALSDYASDTNDIDNIRQTDTELNHAEETFTSNKPVGKKAKIYYRLFEQATSIRLRLTILNDALDLFAYYQDKQHTHKNDSIKQEIAAILQSIADGIQQRTALNKLAKHYAAADALIKELVEQEPDNYRLQQIKIHYKALRNYLHSADKQARLLHKSNKILSWHVHLPHWHLRLPRHPGIQFKNPFSTIQANFTLHSTAFRHAVRLAILMVIASIIYRFSPIERSYWIPISAILVLRPDFSTTFTRGIARLLGTILGVLTISVLLDFLSPTYGTLLIVEVIAAFGAYALLIVNYGLFSYFVTIEIIVLLTFVDKHIIELGFYRIIDTIIGGILALLVYLCWPTWEHLRISTYIADRLETLQHYYARVMDAYIDPDHYDPEDIHQARKQAHLARTNAEAAINRALNEPERYPFDKNISQGLIANADQLAKNLIALEAYLLNMPSHSPLTVLTPLKNTITAALDTIAQSLHGEQMAVEPMSKIENILPRLEARRNELRNQDKAAFTDLSFVLYKSKQIISNLKTMQQLLYTQVEARQTGELSA